MAHPRQCASLSYPRVLRDVLSPSERRLLSGVYWSGVHRARVLRLTYYNLLRTLVEAKPRLFEALGEILTRIQDRIAREFGDRFVIINDFFSYRSADSRLFPGWHQDYEFWLTGRCTSFNLWLLLDHQQLNGSIDIYEVSRNKWLYDRLHEVTDRTSHQRGGRENQSQSPSMVPTAFFKAHGKQDELLPPPVGAGTRVSNLDLAPGDALVVRQVEVHRTDRQPLQPEQARTRPPHEHMHMHSAAAPRAPSPSARRSPTPPMSAFAWPSPATRAQWRLALGFKVLERAPLVRGPLPDSPFSGDLQQVALRWPGLVPPLRLGEAFPEPYAKERLVSYRRRPETWANHAGRMLEARPELRWLLVPVSFAVVALLLALATKGSRSRRRKISAESERAR